MKRRFFLKLLAASVAATSLQRLPCAHAEVSQSQNLELPVKLHLPGAGRLGFYIDYSELDSVGTHKFYVTRTHGTTGVVSCNWSAFDSADGAELAKGILTWEDGALDVLSFEVNILQKPDGDHRIFVLLSNPTGGAELHHGDHTVAYGIIDDDTVSLLNAIFIDADAAEDGDGSQVKPFNNWYSARNAVSSSTRFIYIKGMLVPDGTDDNAAGDSVKHLALRSEFSGRANESQRLIIRNWPKFIGGVDGGSQKDCAGFACDGAVLERSVKYITFRRLDIRGLNNSLGGTINGKSYFIRTRSYRTNLIEHWTAERINIDGIVSGANAAVGVWFSESASHFKLWRWNVSNTSHASRDYNLNTFECYSTDNVSIQRCTINNTAGGFYQKSGVADRSTVGMSCRFNFLDGSTVRLSTLSAKWIQQHHIIQSNIFYNTKKRHDYPPILLDMGNSNAKSKGQHISNNIFYNYNFSTYGDITIYDVGFEGFIAYNNIHSKSKRPWRFNPKVSEALYIDHNQFDGISSPPVFDYRGEWDLSLEQVQENIGFDIHSSLGDPEMNKSSWRLFSTSPSYKSGISGTNKGVYLLGLEQIGAENRSNLVPPERMKSPNVSIINHLL